MKKLTILPLLMLHSILFAQQEPKIQGYPTSKKQDEIDRYFKKDIPDPYRWLEDDNSPETAQWVRQQNEVTNGYLRQLPGLQPLKKELAAMWNFEKYSNPFKEGNLSFFFKNDGLQNQSVLFMERDMSGDAIEFLDPNQLSADGTSSLGNVRISKNQKYCAYSVSGAGSDWQDIFVMDIESMSPLKDKINYTKFGGIEWKGDEGFYYSGYDKPDEKSKFSAKNEFQKIFYHKLGTDQKDDKLIYEDKEHPLRYKSVGLSEDERWLMLSLSEGTDGDELQFLDLKDPAQKSFNMLSRGFTTNQDFIENVDGRFLVRTNFQAPNYRVVSIDPKNPDPSKWINLIPEREVKLESVSLVGDKLFCNYLVNACSRVEISNLAGKIENVLQLPGLGTASGFNGSRKDDFTFYTYTSFNSPPTIFKYSIKSGTSEVYKKTSLNTNMAPTKVEQLWFTSKDGTKVPMFVYYRADLKLTKGPHPVLLYGYGGFNISLTPGFSIPMSYFVQQGGIYVSVSLRGGGEFGEKWHQKGMLAQKQNVFDDFIGAAEHLIKMNITSKERLAIHGRSNGGLLVGACMTQRPDLFKVALPGVGVLDMLRYHKFTVGWGWAVEYGSSEKEDQFNYLLKYSPLHNIRKGTQYPATMITTADHDDRVVPAHSFKFAAALQDAQTGLNPALIRIDTKAGHGAGKPTAKQIDEWSDMLAFTMHHLKMKNR